MREVKILLMAGVITLLFAKCDSKQIIYNFKEDTFVYNKDSLPYGQKRILAESRVSFLTYEFKEGKEPFKIYVRFNGLLPRVSTLEEISLVVSQKNEKGEVTVVEPKELKGFQAEYTNGSAVVSVPLNNKDIFSQVNWKEADWGEYTSNANVDLNGTFVFELSEYPDQLLMKFVIKWKDSEKSFETTLTKTDYVGPKFNPKF